ncbi:uncharacterized protein LOC132725307 [Ruditapes philippinarum]|uniref:uncharacterized protein LOC132725307 n=1 Tax=Ruditapes philippinarum TaxID=129788 RepID=UPI00295AB671|nr:uncharacterized protein LOC132725307 [Ruditapes philippinarum]
MNAARRRRLLQQVALMEMEEEEKDLLFANHYLNRRALRPGRNRRYWVKPWIYRREQLGQYDTLMRELREEDPEAIINYMRLPMELYDEVLARITPSITKQDNKIPGGGKPLIQDCTMQHLASGDSYSSIKWAFRVPSNTMSMFVPEVCQSIIDEYAAEVIACPTTPAEWKEIANEFLRRWNFPHVCGALDGKHVACKCTPNTGSTYHNYEGFFSIVLMALVDADNKFIWLDVGPDGAASDAQIYNECELKDVLQNKTIGFLILSNFFVADNAFQLRTDMMKPFPFRNKTVEERIFNYRLPKARRVMENAFGILAQRFQILLSTMQHTPDNVRIIVQASVCLHNLMRTRYPNININQVDR